LEIFGLVVPIWVLDWTGSGMVVVSLLYLFEKRLGYWYWSNGSLVPYFLLFMAGHQLMLAGLQLTYLIFGVYGLWLWKLELVDDADQADFNARAWYRAGWILSLAIFVFTIGVTDFDGPWAWLEFVVVSLSLLANWATTRKWTWSWPVWLTVNALQAVYFCHFGLWGQFSLQFVLFAMSVYGWRAWVRAPAREPVGHGQV
jgi:nicotinamide mononucleotide transporter